MDIVKKGRNIVAEGVKDFNLEQIFECGQCFHFDKVDENHYVTVAYGKGLRVSQTGDSVTFYDTTMEDYEKIWKYYFDIDTDYGKIKDDLIKKDKNIQKVIESGSGIRILNQEFYETLISFIISQNKQIPHIKKIIGDISSTYGRPVMEYRNKIYYSFPAPEQVCKITEDEYRKLKTGFRASYLVSAGKFLIKVKGKDDFAGLSYTEAKEKLKTIKGVGDKVANCVLLFSLGYRNAFPVDVWIKRIMEQLYFENADTSKEKIMELADKKFMEYGGYAQQYLFYYAREQMSKKIL